MKKSYPILIASVLLAANICFANETNPLYWEWNLFGGIAALSQETSDLIFYEGMPADKLRQSNQSSWAAWTVGSGLSRTLPLFDSKQNDHELQWLPVIKPQLNVYFLQGDMNGVLEQFYEYPGAGVDTDYSIDLNSTRLMFDLALTLASWRDFSIYAMAGIGPSWNRVGFHSDQNNCLQARSLNTYKDINFAFEWGGGIDYTLFDQVSLMVEYLYTSIYSVELAHSGESINMLVSGVESNSFDIHSQALIAGLRYAF